MLKAVLAVPALEKAAGRLSGPDRSKFNGWADDTSSADCLDSRIAVRGGPGRASARGDTGRSAVAICVAGPPPIELRCYAKPGLRLHAVRSGSNSMNRQSRKFWSLMLIASMLTPGCAPQQPFYCREDGDLSHYLGVATQIEYPDVDESPTCEVANTLPPLTLKNLDNYEIWDLTLNEAVQITLCRSQVMRQLGGRVVSTAPETISRTLVSPVAVTTTYDAALVDTTTGLSVGDPFNGSGTEAALSEFDAQLDASVFWEKNREPQNRSTTNAALFPQILRRIWARLLRALRRRVRKAPLGASATIRITRRTMFCRRSLTMVCPRTLPARFLRALGKPTWRPRSAIRCSKGGALNTTGLRVRFRSINTRPGSAMRSTA